MLRWGYSRRCGHHLSMVLVISGAKVQCFFNVFGESLGFRKVHFIIILGYLQLDLRVNNNLWTVSILISDFQHLCGNFLPHMRVADNFWANSGMVSDFQVVLGLCPTRTDGYQQFLGYIWYGLRLFDNFWTFNDNC